MSKTFLCITCEFKATDFMLALHDLGQKVYLVTTEKTRKEAWPHHALQDIFYIAEGDGRQWNMQDVIAGTAYLMRGNKVDRIIALDDYDVSKGATLREEFRLPGMGQTTARHFYDKLAMRNQAREAGINIPGFSGLFNDDEVETFLNNSKPPWFVKPRSDAGALGIRKLKSKEDYYKWSEEHQEDRHTYLIEEFCAGDVYHVDALSQDDKMQFCRASKYSQPPFDIAHGGGVFCSQTLEVTDPENKELKKLNDKVMKAFGMKFGASHTEYIRGENGTFYFLETSARVGGAHLAEMVEAASGVNLWKEWAKIELANLNGNEYKCPKPEKKNAGIVVTLSKFEHQNYEQFTDSSIWWTLNKAYHIGFIFKDKSKDVISEKLEFFTNLIFADYAASVPLVE